MLKCVETAWIVVNRICNFRCYWCIEKLSYSCKHTASSMTIKKAKELTEQAKDLGARQIVIIGGEPTLWEPLFEFNKFCEERKLHTCLATNGCLFGDDNYWKEYTRSPSDSVYVSIKSIKLEQFHEFTQKRGLFFQTMEGIKRLGKYHDNVGAEIVLSDALSDQDVIEMAHFVSSCGIRYMTLDLCVEDSMVDANVKRDRAVRLSQIVYSELDRMFGKGLTYQLFAPLCWWPDNFIEMLQNKLQLNCRCQVQVGNGIVFNSDGKIIPCYSSADKTIVRPQKHIQKCAICKFNTICSGGCPLNILTQNL